MQVIWKKIHLSFLPKRIIASNHLKCPLPTPTYNGNHCGKFQLYELRYTSCLHMTPWEPRIRHVQLATSIYSLPPSSSNGNKSQLHIDDHFLSSWEHDTPLYMLSGPVPELWASNPCPIVQLQVCRTLIEYNTCRYQLDQTTYLKDAAFWWLLQLTVRWGCHFPFQLGKDVLHSVLPTPLR